MEHNTPNILTYFPDSAIKGIDLPQYFTFPFSYKPHTITKIAVAALQHYLETQTDLDHNFVLREGEHEAAVGKMFGVLVVKDKEGKLGYLSAFSGKLSGSNHHSKFVPPVFDMLAPDSFFLRGIEIINTINRQIRLIESGDVYKILQQNFEQSNALALQEIADFKNQLKANKQNRKKLRKDQKGLISEEAYTALEAELVRQSLHDKHSLTVLLTKWEQALAAIKFGMEQYATEIESLKNERKKKSAALQEQLFQQYVFLNKDGNQKSLQSIFKDTSAGKPPAAAGECATPKLLQYAFLNGYQPIAMAEFWWGASPKSEARQHKQFYPACTAKCKPILKHMLEGIRVEEDPKKSNDHII